MHFTNENSHFRSAILFLKIPIINLKSASLKPYIYRFPQKSDAFYQWK